ncbi:hypothetical protein PGT21_011420 [Puccinia graminis f. sp. tritici]|uniref:Uncharacterized protein n=1 Tax=Puccinia graminis f. sp. tritici TaxID=56615 RepID=A0A5B0PTL9_PUCGR|nr:hypothetical protein PGT21_011420 [Puccinia graminis f. sp. tritici]
MSRSIVTRVQQLVEIDSYSGSTAIEINSYSDLTTGQDGTPLEFEGWSRWNTTCVQRLVKIEHHLRLMAS